MTEERSTVSRLVGALIAPAVDAVNPDALIERVDVDGLLERIDLDALLDRIDVDALLERVDLDALLDRIDLMGILDKVDMNALMSRIDVNALIGEIDVNALIGDLDVNALIGELDVNALVARIEINDVMAGVDIQALVARAGIEEMVTQATTGIAARTLDLARRQVVGIDLIVFGAVDRVLRRPKVTIATGEISATGRPAGPVSRLLGFVCDSALVSALFSIAVFFGISLANLFTGSSFSTTRNGGPGWLVAYLVWWFAYLWIAIAISGRTPGKALVGLRVLAVDGGPLSAARSAVRALSIPLSAVLGIGFILGLFRRDRRCLHDLTSGSKEVNDWGDRAVRLPGALEDWVRRNRLDPPSGVVPISEDREAERSVTDEKEPQDHGED